MSIDSYLQSAIVRTSLGDHGLVAWHSGNSGPLVNETGAGTLEAVLLWKAVPDQGQEDSEYPSGTMSFKRQGIDADFSEPVHVPNMWRAAALLGIGCNWEYTAEKHPQAAAWLHGGPCPSLDCPANQARTERLSKKRSAALLDYKRRQKKARQGKFKQLKGHLGPDWTSTSHGYRCGDARIVTWYWNRDHHGYNIYVGGCCIRVKKVQDLLGMLRRLGLPVAA